MDERTKRLLIAVAAGGGILVVAVVALLLGQVGAAADAEDRVAALEERLAALAVEPESDSADATAYPEDEPSTGRPDFAPPLAEDEPVPPGASNEDEGWPPRLEGLDYREEWGRDGVYVGYMRELAPDGPVGWGPGVDYDDDIDWIVGFDFVHYLSRGAAYDHVAAGGVDIPDDEDFVENFYRVENEHPTVHDVVFPEGAVFTAHSTPDGMGGSFHRVAVGDLLQWITSGYPPLVDALWVLEIEDGRADEVTELVLEDIMVLPD